MSEPIAQLFPQAGRFHLAVAGVVVATQGDPCRDFSMREKYGSVWGISAMEELEARINSSR